MFLLHAVTEFSAIGIDANTIRIGDEVTQDAIEKYSAFLARYVFPPKHLLGVRAVVADGNSKVLIKCCRGSTAPKRAGAPRKGRAGEKREAKHYWNGWFFFLCPKTGRILQTSPMYRPENNDFVLDELEKVVDRYPHVNCFIYDRACKIQKSVLQRKKRLWKIRTYTTDKFHGPRHKKNCAANPHTKPRLMARIENLNTSIAEQTFSWFRGYARSMNELRPTRHQFLVLLYAKMHNELMAKGEMSHLNPYSHQNMSKKRPVPYGCDDDPQQAKRGRGADPDGS